MGAMKIEKVEVYKVGDKVFESLEDAEGYVNRSNVIAKLEHCFDNDWYHGEYHFSDVYAIVEKLELSGMKIVFNDNNKSSTEV